MKLYGVHHTARPTWKLKETVEFYRDKVGLPLTHVISARGWGREGHPDFLHFFFDSGQGSTIAFFYYIGTQRPDYLEPRLDNHNYRATHTAWQVKTREELVAWKERLEAKGIEVSPYTKHEVLESIYFDDPNGYNLEITWQSRPLNELDAEDARLSLEAAMQLEAEAGGVSGMKDIDSVWRKKAELLEQALAE
jgi:catechol 2,3-dioxygenase-like lactoylglutathione lyase family enzyme